MLGTYYVYDSNGPVTELLSRQLGFSDTQIGSLNAAYSPPNVALSLAGGILVDRVGARAIVVSTSLICLAGAVLTALGSHFPVMMLGRFLLGDGIGNADGSCYCGTRAVVRRPLFRAMFCVDLQSGPVRLLSRRPLAIVRPVSIPTGMADSVVARCRRDGYGI